MFHGKLPFTYNYKNYTERSVTLQEIPLIDKQQETEIE